MSGGLRQCDASVDGLVGVSSDRRIILRAPLAGQFLFETTAGLDLCVGSS